MEIKKLEDGTIEIITTTSDSVVYSREHIEEQILQIQESIGSLKEEIEKLNHLLSYFDK